MAVGYCVLIGGALAVTASGALLVLDGVRWLAS